MRLPSLALRHLSPVRSVHPPVKRRGWQSARAGGFVEKATKGKLTSTFDFTTLYTGIQDAFLAAAAVGAVVVATRFGAKWVKKALSSIS